MLKFASPTPSIIYEPIAKYMNAYTADTFRLDKLTERMKMTIETGPWLAGGAVRKLLMNEPVLDGDLDFFFKTMGQLRLFQERYVRVHKEGGWTRQNNSYTCGKTSAIFRQFYPSIESLFGSFDLTVCQFITDGVTVGYTAAAMKDAIERNLVDAGNFTAPTIQRILKYFLKGFVPEEGFLSEMLYEVFRHNLFFGIDKLDTDYYEQVLKDIGYIHST